MGFKYTGSGYTENTFTPIPEGEQSLMIESIKEGESQSGNHMLTIVLRKDDKHGKIFHYVVLNNKRTTKNIGDLLAAVGRDPKQDGEIEWDSFKGDWLDARVVHEEYKGQVSAKVKWFITGKAKQSTPAPAAGIVPPAPSGEDIPI